MLKNAPIFPLSIDHHFEISVNLCDLMSLLQQPLLPLSNPSLHFLPPSINTHSHTNTQKYTQKGSRIDAKTDKNTHTTPCSGYSTIRQHPPTHRRIDEYAQN